MPQCWYDATDVPGKLLSGDIPRDICSDDPMNLRTNREIGGYDDERRRCASSRQ